MRGKDVRLDEVVGVEDRVLAGVRWPDGRLQYRVVTIRDGRIVEMLDFDRRRRAAEAAGLR
jgi:hypothetical protein